MNNSNNIKKLYFLAFFFFASGFLSGFFISSSNYEKEKHDFLTEGELNIEVMEYVWDILHNEYLNSGDVDDRVLAEGILSGMVKAAGDRYTVFLNSEETSIFSTNFNNRFEGVGMEVGVRDGDIVVVSPLNDSPAERAGVMAGDRIISIDEKSTRSMSLDEAVSLIRGEKGTEVMLRIWREEKLELFDIKIRRENIVLTAVEYKSYGDIAYIKLNSFSKDVVKRTAEIASVILRDGKKGVILDLRNNPGGLLEGAVGVASLFLDGDFLIVKEKRISGEEKLYKTSEKGILSDLPLVILQNKGSASASEIVTGSLSDVRSAPIIGEKSFGKGTVQLLQSLPGKTSIKYTVAEWITPSGKNIDEKGIEPTIVIEDDIETEEDEALNRALEEIHSMI